VGLAQQACGELLDPLGNVDLLAGVLLLEAVLGKFGVLAEDGSESVPTRTSPTWSDFTGGRPLVISEPNELIALVVVHEIVVVKLGDCDWLSIGPEQGRVIWRR